MESDTTFKNYVYCIKLYTLHRLNLSARFLTSTPTLLRCFVLTQHVLQMGCTSKKGPALRNYPL